MKQNILHLVYATDKGYLLPTVVAACSAAYWVSDASQLVIDVLDCGIDDADWDLLCSKVSRVKIVSMRRYKIDMTQFDRYRIWNNSRGIYARLLLPDILTDDDWCVYCDGDTLFTADPLELKKFFDVRYAILGHIDHGGDYREWFERRGFVWDASRYLCAGFLAINLDWMRRHNGVRRLFDFIDQFNPPLNDQHAYYAVCAGNIGVMDPPWGEFSVYVNDKTLHGCIHFAAVSPWRMPKYSIHTCVYDTTRLWFVYAKRLCGYTLRDCDKRWTLLGYICRLVLTNVLRVIRLDRRGVVPSWRSVICDGIAVRNDQ